MVEKVEEKEVKVLQKVTLRYMEQGDFIDFLSKKGVLPKFVANLVRQHPGFHDIKHPFERVFEDDRVRLAIDGSFIWERTPEGHEFWRNIASDWREKCTNLGVEDTWASE